LVNLIYGQFFMALWVLYHSSIHSKKKSKRLASMRILHVYYKLYHHATDCPVHFQFQYHLQDWPTPKTPDSDRSEIFQNCPDAFLFIEGRVPRLPFRLVACLVTRFWQINGFKPDNGWLISLPKLRHKLFWFFVNYLVSASAKFPRPEACVAILSPGVEWMELGGSKTATKSWMGFARGVGGGGGECEWGKTWA